MTIYWERCGVCGRYETVRQCTLFKDVLVDIHCCILCVKRSVCPAPAWKIALPAKPVATARTGLSVEEKKRLIDELTSLLEKPGKKDA
ncbi:hypothetical protein [Thermosphaera sp.]|uniref:Uncharacterized protein n=1 Tax=Thermosphaera aggregans TaxID=54254 RepID=A0A7C2BL23_9CREN